MSGLKIHVIFCIHHPIQARLTRMENTYDLHEKEIIEKNLIVKYISSSVIYSGLKTKKKNFRL